ncbi:MAG: hypothetical protein M0Z67_17125 [Nitrospiraceae bacterium]|nr:hypothetical protein [Nitrospiraceae bacterium]
MKSEPVGAGFKPARLEIGGRILERAGLTKNLPEGWEWKTLGEISNINPRIEFSRLDEAVTGLKRIKANLKRYKAAVLKAAVEGKLTEEWRKEHPDIEPAGQLLKSILAERKKKWEEKNPGKKYKEPAVPDTSNLPELPKGWVWATLDQLSTNMVNGFGKRSQSNGLPCIVIRLADIVEGEISLANARHINCLDDEIAKYSLVADDLLILRVNGSPDLVGRFVIVSSNISTQTLFCDHFIRLRTVKQTSARWLRLYTDTKRFRRFIDLNKVSSAGQNTISQGTLGPFALPLPPHAEQSKIIEEVESRLSIVYEIEATVEANLKRADRLVSGTTGKDVPQNCCRSRLLKRIVSGDFKRCFFWTADLKCRKRH